MAAEKWETDDYPDWRDSGRAIEIVLENGQTVIGTLRADDDWYDVPIFRVEADGAMHEFAAFQRYRLL